MLDENSPFNRECRADLLRVLRKYCPDVDGISCEYEEGRLSTIRVA
jgi:hypothetical protein